jgi:hypothetical protein
MGVFLPEGQQLDSPLSMAIVDALPEGTTFGFNGAEGRTWIHVFGPDGSLGREVLNTALVSPGARQLKRDARIPLIPTRRAVTPRSPMT